MSKSILNSYSSREELYLYNEAKRGKRPLTIHVEDKFDRNFWMRMFAPYAKTMDIRYVWQHEKFTKNKESKSSGKSIVMSMIRDSKICLSQDEIVCVDADYDLLIEDTYTDTINANPYIFTTKWYAVENIICHHTNLEDLFITLSEEDIHLNFKEFLEAEARKYAPMFLLHLVCRQYYNSGEYSMDALTNDIKAIETGTLTVKEALKQHGNYIATMQCYIDELEERIKANGYEREDYYKIMQGHLLKSQIVYPFLKSHLMKDELLSKEEQRLELSLDDFFLFGYSLEYLDVTQEIREKIAARLNLK